MTFIPNSPAARDVAYQLHPYTDARRHEEAGPLVITRGEGVYVFDDAGNRYIETFAKVVRLTDPPSSGQAALSHGIAVEFHGMQPAVREILIQHMFSRESETLRMRRLQAEAAKLED